MNQTEETSNQSSQIEETSAKRSATGLYIWIGTILTFVLLGVGISYTYFYFIHTNSVTSIENPPEEPLEDIYLEEAQNSFRDLNFDETVSVYQRMLTDENVEDKTRPKLLLGGVYNRAGDYQRGIPILQEIVADPATSGELRMEALVTMIAPYYRWRWKEPLQLVFAEGTWPHNMVWKGQEFDSESLADLEVALRDLLMVANNEHPLSYLQYTSALWYSGKLMDDTIFDENIVSDEDRVLYAQIVTQRVAEGDRLLALEEKDPEFKVHHYTYENWFIANHFRFVTYSFMARYDSQYVPIAESNYAQLMDNYARYTSSASKKNTENFTRFYYAAFLVDIYGAEAQADIAATMAPLLETVGDRSKANSVGIWPFFERELTRPVEERGHNERFIYLLAKQVPALQSFLEREGWFNEERAALFTIAE